VTSLLVFQGELRERQALGCLETLYLHRARRETPYGRVAGRGAIAAEVLDELNRFPDQVIEFGPCVGCAASFTVEAGAGAARRLRYKVHHWATLEGERIASEVVIRDEGAICTQLGLDPEARARAIGEKSPVFRPLGELRSGQGQLSTDRHALLPVPVSAVSGAVIDAWHRIWNGRALDEVQALYAEAAEWAGPSDRNGGRSEFAAWVRSILASHPDASLLFDRIEEQEGRIAILWRLFAHRDGRRIRMLGSTFLDLRDGQVIADDTLLDEVAVLAQQHQPFLEL
jgi:predicted ester cyclase